jgi:hypothetical protein
MKGTRQFAGTLLLLVGVGACGDPLLPADFTGPPTGAVNGVVVGEDPGVAPAAQPQLSLQWLAPDRDDGRIRLVPQPLTFTRAAVIESDWNIDLARPRPSLQSEIESNHGDLRMLVGKIVYFDDSDGDGTLSWDCAESPCDRAVASGQEFVVYVLEPVVCRNAGEESINRIETQLLSTGYHYFRYRGTALEEIDSSQPMRFLIESNATVDEETLRTDLETFSSRIVRKFSVNSLGGCPTSAAML